MLWYAVRALVDIPRSKASLAFGFTLCVFWEKTAYAGVVDALCFSVNEYVFITNIAKGRYPDIAQYLLVLDILVQDVS